jgi:hypothetical protein
MGPSDLRRVPGDQCLAPRSLCARLGTRRDRTTSVVTRRQSLLVVCREAASGFGAMGADVRRPSCAPARREAENSHTGESRVYYRTIVDQQAKNLPRVQWVERQADGRFLAACARLGQIPAGLRPRNTGPANEMRAPRPLSFDCPCARLRRRPRLLHPPAKAVGGAHRLVEVGRCRAPALIASGVPMRRPWATQRSRALASSAKRCMFGTVQFP